MLSMLPRDALGAATDELGGRAFDLRGERDCFAPATAGGLRTTLESALWRGCRASFGAGGIGAWLIMGVGCWKKSSWKTGNGSGAGGPDDPAIGD
jgi:hypothetical protein